MGVRVHACVCEREREKDRVRETNGTDDDGEYNRRLNSNPSVEKN